MKNADMFGGVPLPSEDQYVKAIQQIRSEEPIDSVRGIDEAIQRASLRNQGFMRLMRVAEAIGEIVEPIDRSTGNIIDETRVTTRAIKYGMAFGGLLVPRVHSDIVPIGAFEIAVPEVGTTNDPRQERFELAEYLIDFGGVGLASMGGIAEQELEDIEDRVVIDVTKRKRFRTGCGIMARYAVDAHIEHNERLLNETLASEEWDISKLF